MIAARAPYLFFAQNPAALPLLVSVITYVSSSKRAAPNQAIILLALGFDP